jgi:hypothetical protein
MVYTGKKQPTTYSHFDDTFQLIKSSQSLNKFEQKIKPETLVLEQMTKDFIVATGKLKDEFILKKSSKPSYLGVFIYSHARDYMYRTCLNQFIVLQTDTDSAFMPLIESNRFESLYPDLCPLNRNKIYGDWEDDLDKVASAFISIAPKCYLAINCKNDNSNKARFKGVRPNWTWLPQQIVENDLGENYQENKTDSYIEDKLSSALPCLNEQMFNELLDNNKICVFASQLEKTKFKRNEISTKFGKAKDLQYAIRQTFLIKTIN